MDVIVQAPVEVIETVDSTNSEAMRWIARGVTGPLWLRARVQTAGKGRAGRRWVSEGGNFYGSLILPLDVPRTVVSHVSLIAAVALYDALTEACGGRVEDMRVKWPNDVLVGFAKVAGILAESTTTTDGQLVVVLGIGVNLSNPPRDLGRQVGAVVAKDGTKIDPAALVAPLSHWLGHWIGLWSAGENFRAVQQAWLARAGREGEAIVVNTGTGPVDGTYAGLDEDGGLLMRRPDGRLQVVTFGDVSLRLAE